jgi:hypothetical protein
MPRFSQVAGAVYKARAWYLIEGPELFAVHRCRHEKFTACRWLARIHRPPPGPGFPELRVRQHVFGWAELFTVQRLLSEPISTSTSKQSLTVRQGKSGKRQS